MNTLKICKLEFKPDFERAKKYWDAFWAHEIIDRPCTVIWAAKSPKPVSQPRLQPADHDFQQMFDIYDQHLATHEFLGECIPGFRPGFGPDQMAAFLGVPLIISPDSNDTSWTEKIVTDWQGFLPIELDENNYYYKRMKEFHQQAQGYYKDKCLIYNIDFHSNIDLLEALRGAQNLLFDIIDNPDLIQQAMKQVMPIYEKIYDELYKYGDKETLGNNSGMHLYSRGKTDYIQADFIALLNPQLMRKFVLPAIEAEAEFLDNSCFHLDGPDALNHLDDILSIKEIEAIQWLPGAGRKPGYEWPEVIHKIQKAGKSAVIYGKCEEIKSIHGLYKPELLVYDVQAESVDKGQELLEWLNKNT